MAERERDVLMISYVHDTHACHFKNSSGHSIAAPLSVDGAAKPTTYCYELSLLENVRRCMPASSELHPKLAVLYTVVNVSLSFPGQPSFEKCSKGCKSISLLDQGLLNLHLAWLELTYFILAMLSPSSLVHLILQFS